MCLLSYLKSSGSHLEDTVVSQGHLAMPGHIFGCYSSLVRGVGIYRVGGVVLLASSEERPGVLVNSCLHRTAPTTKNDLAPSVRSTKVEQPCFRGCGEDDVRVKCFIDCVELYE